MRKRTQSRSVMCRSNSWLSELYATLKGGEGGKEKKEERRTIITRMKVFDDTQDHSP